MSRPALQTAQNLVLPEKAIPCALTWRRSSCTPQDVPFWSGKSNLWASGRVRPAALGFVVMASPEDAERAFAHADHLIRVNEEGVRVEVTRFRDGSDSLEENL